MQYHDPSRPQVAHRPAYVSKSGRPIAPIPQLSISPSPDDGALIEVGCWLIDEGIVTARYYFTDIPISDLPALLHRWINDPEEVLSTTFKYHLNPQLLSIPKVLPITARGAPIRPVLTLDDLGLI